MLTTTRRRGHIFGMRSRLSCALAIVVVLLGACVEIGGANDLVFTGAGGDGASSAAGATDGSGAVGSGATGGSSDGGGGGEVTCDDLDDCVLPCKTGTCNSSGFCDNWQYEAVNTACAEGGTVCDGAGNCVKEDGATCSDGAECLSEVCADAVCCDVACDGPCQSCSETGSEGQCVKHAAATNPETPACMEGAVCDGSGVCATGAHIWSISLGGDVTGDHHVRTAVGDLV